MRIRSGLVAVVAATMLAGCASVPESRPDVPPGKPAVNGQQAGRVFDRYDSVNNEANATRDADAIATVETGPLLETTLTGFRLAEANEDDLPDPFYHTDVAAYSPRFESYPMWFVATSRINSDPSRIVVQALTRDGASGEWILEQAANLGEVELPPIRLDQDATPAVTEEQVSQVTTLLEQIYEYLAGGDAPAGVDVAVEGLDTYRTWAAESTIDLDEVTAPEISCQTDDRAEIRVLPTSGGVLGIATGRCTLAQSVEEDVSGDMTLGGELGVLAPEPGRTVEFVSSHPFVVSVPDSGAAQVFSGGWRWADVTMSGGEEADDEEDE
jgi:hypothetical protein